MYSTVLALSILFIIVEAGLLISSFIMCIGYGKKVLGTVSNLVTVEPWGRGVLGRRPYRRYKVIYSYRYDGTVYSSGGIMGVHCPKCQFGDHTTMYVNAKQPEKAYSAFDRTQILCDHIVMLLLILISMILLMVL